MKTKNNTSKKIDESSLFIAILLCFLVGLMLFNAFTHKVNTQHSRIRFVPPNSKQTALYNNSERLAELYEMDYCANDTIFMNFTTN